LVKSIFFSNQNSSRILDYLCRHAAIPYRASTGPEQDFPFVVFPHTGFLGDENRFFPVGNTTQGKPCFHYRDGFSVHPFGK